MKLAAGSRLGPYSRGAPPVMSSDRAGVIRIQNVSITPDGRSYAYSLSRILASDLFVVSGWR